MTALSPAGTFTDEQLNWLRHRAIQAAPYEACGFIMKDGSTVEIRNVALNPTRNFEIDRKQLAEKQIDPENVAALWHTHPSGSSFPSPTDQANMAALGEAYGDWLYLIATKNEVRQYSTATDWSKFA